VVERLGEVTAIPQVAVGTRDDRGGLGVRRLRKRRDGASGSDGFDLTSGGPKQVAGVRKPDVAVRAGRDPGEIDAETVVGDGVLVKR
jgi:hypothetical protein